MTVWDSIDKIIYINLLECVDRNINILNELSIICPSKIIRFNAIKEDKGAIGCTKSHIKCLEMAIENNWNTVLIIEDDAMWYNYDKNILVLENLIIQSFDVILLGGMNAKFDKKTYKLFSALTTTAYIVKSHYYNVLLQNFNTGLKLLETDYDITKYALDQYWRILQKKDNWYIVNPALMIQRPSYSNILKINVDYKQYFNTNERSNLLIKLIAGKR